MFMYKGAESRARASCGMWARFAVRKASTRAGLHNLGILVGLSPRYLYNLS